MEYQGKDLKNVLREDLVDWGVRPNNDSAAMVFEEAASHKPHKSGHLDPVVGSHS